MEIDDLLPYAYTCPENCGCLWRDNRDGTMSLFGGAQHSCEACERLPLDKLTPLFKQSAIDANLEAANIKISMMRTVVSESQAQLAAKVLQSAPSGDVGRLRKLLKEARDLDLGCHDMGLDWHERAIEALALPLPEEASTIARSFNEECDAADQLLSLLGLDPDSCRTDGGAINMARVLTFISEKQPTATASVAEPVGEIVTVSGDYKNTSIPFAPYNAPRWYSGIQPPPGTKLFIAPPSDELARLRAGLVKANSQAEEFERKWYLQGDELAALQSKNDELQARCDGMAWQPIEKAPTGANGIHFMQLAWGPEEDRCTGSGMRVDDRFYVTAPFYCLGNKEKPFKFREIEVKPTHWALNMDAPPVAGEGASDD